MDNYPLMAPVNIQLSTIKVEPSSIEPKTKTLGGTLMCQMNKPPYTPEKRRNQEASLNGIRHSSFKKNNHGLELSLICLSYPQLIESSP